MSEYGIIVKDTSGNTVKITPDVANVVASGTASMPNGLVDTNKYYVSIDLPGSSNINVIDIGSIFNVFLLNICVHTTVAEHPTGRYMFNYFAEDNYSHYTKNLSTGVMTSWTPGDVGDLFDASRCDGLFSTFAVAYWEKMGADMVTDVKAFAAMMYHIYDGSASAFIDAYTIYTSGVEKIDYVVTMRWKTEE